MIRLLTLRRAFLVFPFLMFSALCWGQNALVVHDGTAGLEASVLANLTGKLVAAGYTVTPSVGVPGGSLATYRQIWDIRFNVTTPLTGSDITAYVAYLAGGGSLFVMGENTGFNVRNNTIVTLIQTAGGGTITIATPANAQTVQTPFTGPNPITNITFLAAAGTASPGTGSFATMDASNIGAAIVWSPGRLSAATAGTLMVVFDVNFLDAGADANSQAFSNNMIAYLAAPTVVGVPTLSQWAMILLASGLMFVAARRLLAKRQTASNIS